MALVIEKEDKKAVRLKTSGKIKRAEEIFYGKLQEASLSKLEKHIDFLLRECREEVLHPQIDWTTYDFLYEIEMYEQIQKIMCVAHRLSQILDELERRTQEGDRRARWLLCYTVIEAISKMPFLYLTKEAFFSRLLPYSDSMKDSVVFHFNTQKERENYAKIVRYLSEEMEKEAKI